MCIPSSLSLSSLAHH